MDTCSVFDSFGRLAATTFNRLPHGNEIAEINLHRTETVTTKDNLQSPSNCVLVCVLVGKLFSKNQHSHGVPYGIGLKPNNKIHNNGHTHRHIWSKWILNINLHKKEVENTMGSAVRSSSVCWQRNRGIFATFWCNPIDKINSLSQHIPFQNQIQSVFDSLVYF